MPNECCGIGGPSPRPVSSRGRRDRANHQERTTRLKAGGVGGGIGEDGCNGRHVPVGSSSEGLVRKKQSLVRKKQSLVRKNQSMVQEKEVGVHENHGSIREKEDSVRAKKGSVCEQIRQVVSDLEGVLGGLKQVHVEMKEVVQQIDRLTANIDLEEEEGSCNKSPSSDDGLPNPRDCKGVLMFNQGDQRPQYRDMDRTVNQKTTRVQVHTHWTGTGDLVHNHKTPGDHGPQCRDTDHTAIIHDPPPDPRDVSGVHSQKTNGDQGVSLLYRHPDHTVTIRTNSSSPVLTASVIKTNRVGITVLSPMGPLSPSKGPKQDRRGLNGHPPLLGPGRELNHVAPHTPLELEMTPSLPLPLWSQLSDPTAMVGYSVPTLRNQKPPLYPRHNGRVERLSKSPAQPPYPAYPAHPALPVLPHLAQPPYPTHPNHPTHPALPPSDLKTPPYPGKGCSMV
ncbi:uncharacterized protein LOC115157529 [Salmo trutta]|uniref:uncharacterized protein LOC115157529 n=1 Tax=Salmo trutta TaxID=8032 RepID=UPI001131D2E6|nr:uncharacterized protein LOC115157529 [Salmo trutta]